MRLSEISALILLLSALGGGALAQTEEAPAEGETQEEEAAPTEPEYNGQASGTVSGAGFSVPVVCAGLRGDGTVTATSDPDGGGQDINGDGVIFDITAQRSGQITMNLLAGGIAFAFDDDKAEINRRELTYAVTINFGSSKERIEYRMTCDR